MNVFSNKSKKICWPQVHFRFSDLFPLLNRNSRTCSAFVHIKHAKLAQKLYPNGFAYELQKKENTEDQQPQHQHSIYNINMYVYRLQKHSSHLWIGKLKYEQLVKRLHVKAMCTWPQNASNDANVREYDNGERYTQWTR